MSTEINNSGHVRQVPAKNQNICSKNDNSCRIIENVRRTRTLTKQIKSETNLYKLVIKKMLKMATYPGMSLAGEVRESISLDEDDLSDVEDEVFIRDGKNSYKLAEELTAKRPLMAPRRRLGKPDITTRLKARPPCRAFCKPCCYITAALSVLIGLIVLVVVLVSIYPLPLNKLRDWVIAKSKIPKPPLKLLPCSNLKVTDVWAIKIPVLTTDSPLRNVDVDRDGVDDIIFGFGTGENYDILPSEIFCPVFLGVPPPCQGGVVALNGTTGDIVWRYWMNDTIFTLHCIVDLNGDGMEDCLAVGVDGTIVAIDSKNGSMIWRQNNNKLDVFVPNFIADINNDSVPDILSSHTSLDGTQGHLVLFSGKTGEEIKKISTPDGTKTFFMPQILKVNSSYHLVVFGTGTPNSPGNLSVTPLTDIINGNLTPKSIYEDHYSGVITQPVLVDLTGDKVPDIVAAMYNSTIVAINGATLAQIWNFTVPSSETNIAPTPGYFNDDNITDFLIIYQKYDNILNYNYTKTFIIDGKTGKTVYEKPIVGSVTTQMGGLTISMEGHGFDMFLFWTTECANVEMYKNNGGVLKTRTSEKLVDACRQQFNSTSILKLNALNQYDQPPGFEIYTSVNRSNFEVNNVKSPLKQIKEYFIKHPKLQVANQGQSEIDENYGGDSRKIRVHKYGSSSFRHKDNKQGLVKDYINSGNNIKISGDNVARMGGEDTRRISDEAPGEPKYDPDYDWQDSQANLGNILPGDIDPDFNNYNLEDPENTNLFNQKQQMLFDEVPSINSRDPRSKDETTKSEVVNTPSKKKNLSDPKYGVYDYKNVHMARTRLLHDLNNIPTEILRDTYFKNRENQLRKSKFEQRDINSHIDKMKENREVTKIVEEEKTMAKNTSFNLWDLESEKELQDKDNGYWRGKRETIKYPFEGIRKISSVAAMMKSLNSSNNTIDIVFVTYWQPLKIGSRASFDREIEDCIEEKLSNTSEDTAHEYQKTTEDEQRALFTRECENEQENFKSDFLYASQIYQLALGQMTVYRIQIECQCNVVNVDEKCAKILPQDEQSWAMYLGRLGDGVFQTRN